MSNIEQIAETAYEVFTTSSDHPDLDQKVDDLVGSILTFISENDLEASIALIDSIAGKQKLINGPNEVVIEVQRRSRQHKAYRQFEYDRIHKIASEMRR